MYNYLFLTRSDVEDEKIRIRRQRDSCTQIFLQPKLDSLAFRAKILVDNSYECWP